VERSQRRARRAGRTSADHRHRASSRGGGRPGWDRRGRSRPGHLRRLACADGCALVFPPSPL